MNYLYLAIAAIGPMLLILKGKKYLGEQTHPAAIFILAWMLCLGLLMLPEEVPFSKRRISFLWVAVCFFAIEAFRKKSAARSDSPEATDPDGSTPKDD